MSIKKWYLFLHLNQTGNLKFLNQNMRIKFNELFFKKL
jgi:hypothetical protein